MALQYKDVVSLAETGSSALVATIRQLGVVQLQTSLIRSYVLVS